MCKFCNYNSEYNEIYKEPLTDEWYLEVQTSEWDSYNDDYFYERVYGINYCPYCGRKLNTKEKDK